MFENYPIFDTEVKHSRLLVWNQYSGSHLINTSAGESKEGCGHLVNHHSVMERDKNL